MSLTARLEPRARSMIVRSGLAADAAEALMADANGDVR